MDWLLHKYIGIVSTRLDKFKRKSASLYNFRCPIAETLRIARVKPEVISMKSKVRCRSTVITVGRVHLCLILSR
jgi:hypothetical protein